MPHLVRRHLTPFTFKTDSIFGRLQELVHISCIEPGANMCECSFNNADFEVPAFWIENVPKEGLLTMFYCRTAEVIARVRANVKTANP